MSASTGQQMYLKALRGSCFSAFMPGHVYVAPPAQMAPKEMTRSSFLPTPSVGPSYGLKRNLPARTTLRTVQGKPQPQPMQIGALDAPERFTDIQPGGEKLDRAETTTYLVTRCLKRSSPIADARVTPRRNVPTLSRDAFADLLSETAKHHDAKQNDGRTRLMDPYATPDNAAFQQELRVSRHDQASLARHAHLNYTAYKPLHTRVVGRFLNEAGRGQHTVGVNGVTGVLRNNNERQFAPGIPRDEPQMFYVSDLRPNSIASPANPRTSGEQAAVMTHGEESNAMAENDHYLLHFTQQNPNAGGAASPHFASSFISRGASFLPSSYHATSNRRQYQLQQQQQRQQNGAASRPAVPPPAQAGPLPFYTHLQRKQEQRKKDE